MIIIYTIASIILMIAVLCYPKVAARIVCNSVALVLWLIGAISIGLALLLNYIS